MTMTTIETIAHDIFNGSNQGLFVSVNPGRTRNSFALWQYNYVDGWKISYKFIKLIGIKDVEGQYADLVRIVGLTSNWHTQANVTRDINKILKELRANAREEAAVVPFGKYKGMKVEDLTDCSYLCWLGNQPSKEDDSYRGIDGWLHTAAKNRAIELGCVVVGSNLIDLNDESTRFNKNTSNIYKAIQSNSTITYVAEQNNGGIWSAYNINLPTTVTGHRFYGMCECLKVDHKARRAKGLTINIYDYTVEGNNIKVNKFFVIQ